MASGARLAGGIILLVIGSFFFLIFLLLLLFSFLLALLVFIVFVLPFWIPGYYLLRSPNRPPAYNAYAYSSPTPYAYAPLPSRFPPTYGSPPPPMQQVIVEKTMMKCPYCGTIYDMSLGRCTACGASA